MSKESPWPSSTSLRVYTHASLQFSGNGVENRNDNNVITTHAPPIHIHGRWRVESPNHPFSHYDYIKPQTLSFQNPFHALSHCVLLGLFMHTWSAEWMTLLPMQKAKFSSTMSWSRQNSNEKKCGKCKMLSNAFEIITTSFSFRILFLYSGSNATVFTLSGCECKKLQHSHSHKKHLQIPNKSWTADTKVRDLFNFSSAFIHSLNVCLCSFFLLFFGVGTNTHFLCGTRWKEEEWVELAKRKHSPRRIDKLPLIFHSFVINFFFSSTHSHCAYKYVCIYFMRRAIPVVNLCTKC